MSLILEQAAFLRDVRRLLDEAETRKFVVTGGELERKPETQALYLRSGYAKSMDSMHLRKCAIRLNFFIERDDRLELVQDAPRLQGLGEFWQQLDPRNLWGGNWTLPVDAPHFERDLGAWPAAGVGVLADPATPARVPLAAAAEVRPVPVLMPAASSAPEMPGLRRGSTERSAVTRLQTLLVTLKLLERTDGDFGEKTERAVIAFQQKHALVADGQVGEKTWTALLAQTGKVQQALAQRWLGDADLDAAAASLQIEPAAMRAVYKVESNGAGFVGDNPKILFEGHVFWQRLKLLGFKPETLANGQRDILYPSWTRQHYVGGAAEYQRLRRAEAIQPEAARESASWGLFQIMGYHWKSLDYASIDDFVERMRRHERDQLEAFTRYITVNKDRQGRKLLALLKAKDWAAFAYAYNGAGYRQNAYDDKLRDAYRRYSA